MLFLLLRLMPALVPLLFFISTKAAFYYIDEWQWALAAVLILPLAYFALLKYKDRSKRIIWPALYAVIFAATGFVYSLILENPLIINIYLISWSLIYALYLEAFFHDFYETAKVHILDLFNITHYGNILIIFFATAALVSFNIFLNLPWLALLVIFAAVCFSVIYLAFERSGLERRHALLYSAVIDLILAEILGGLLLLPASFYVIAAIAALCYYLLTQTLLYAAGNKLSRKFFIELLGFSALILIIVAATAAWL